MTAPRKHRLLVSFASILLLATSATLVACDGDSEPDACAEGAGLVICEGDSNCAYDPATIDCTAGCTNLGQACSGGCSLPGCTDYSQSNCETGCNFAKNQACSNITFGCMTESDSCATITSCIASHR